MSMMVILITIRRRRIRLRERELLIKFLAEYEFRFDRFIAILWGVLEDNPNSDFKKFAAFKGGNFESIYIREFVLSLQT